MDFVHLNCRSDRSVGYGLIRPKDLVEYYHQGGCKAACITDFGNMNAAVQLDQACQKYDMTPIFGVELSVTLDKSKRDQTKSSIILIAINKIGFFNLIRLTTIGSMYFYYHPRVDYDSIRQYSEGIIALTSGISGVAAQQFFLRRKEGLMICYQQLSDIFDDRFYFQLGTSRTETQRIYNEELIEFCEINNAKCIVSGDPHYLKDADSDLHKIMMKARNFRNYGWKYPLNGLHHVISRNEIFDELSFLHGFDVRESSSILQAIKSSEDIVNSIERFSLREGIKIPVYKE